ncbi:MAG: asparagine synthase (glutamine-hydrolyzing) [Acidobacteria bacterium]|nr:asparagine synthase (glutamine-hydrolyzing) [Acidobacteriota bacterium]
MCGLCGEVRFDGGPVEAAAVVSMRDRMPHRGPDASGLYVSPKASAGLGFRRLKIVDLSDVANQPMPNEDGTVQVVFNGEIYNFQGLRDELLRSGHRFRSRSDTEVIVHLYEAYGPQCIDKLDGMFAIAIWDDRRQRLVLARDRAGKKPLFYLNDGRRIVFASEIKAFFGRRDLEISIDPQAIPYYFIYGYVPCPHTFYRGVRQVEPGSVITVERDGTQSSRTFWRLQFPTQHDIPQENFDRPAVKMKLRRLMTDAVERRLVSDVPLGAFLSGGVDSTIIVGLMSQLLDRPVKTFSIGFKDSPGYDETSYARLSAKRFKTDHTEFIVEPGAFDLIDKLVWHHDGPFGDSSAVPTYLVSQLTRRQVTVVLTGDGGDELFAGYLRFYAALTAERTPQVLRRALKAVSLGLPVGGSARHVLSRIQRFATAASLPLEERMTRWSSLFYDDIEALLAPELLRSAAPVDKLRYLRRFHGSLRGRSTLSQILTINFNTYLLDDLLIKADRCTMANSLEARSPFLDTALIEYVAGLPDSMKLARGRTKIILRETFDDLIPQEIQRRGKMGFGIPFGLWFRGALRDVLHDHLLSPQARYRDYLSSSYVHRLVKRHDEGEADLGLPLWTLLSFEVWLRSFPRWVNEQPAETAAAPA